MRNMMKRIGVAAGAGVLAFAGIAATGTPAMAASSWTAQYTDADIIGAHGYGTFEWYTTTTTTARVTATVKDTATDSHGARLYVRWERNDGVRQDAGYVSASGKDDKATKVFSLPATQYYAFEVMECLTEAGATMWDSCGDWSYPG